MKKHFLILMLMALLPLAGWAQSVSSVYIPDAYYGTEPDQTQVVAYSTGGAEVAASAYSIDGYFSDANCTVSVDAATIKAAAVGSSFYFKVTGKNGFTGSASTKFNIVRMPLVLTGSAGSKTYGTTADGTVFTLTSVKDKTGKDLSTTFTTAKFAFTRANGTNAGDYDIIATITDATLAANYSVASADILNKSAAKAQYVINPKDFSNTGESPTVTLKVSADLTYNSKVQKSATVEVKDIALEKTLVEGTDFTVTYVTEKDDYKSAGAHTATITGKGNYAATSLTGTYTIDPATLLVTPSYTKVYNGLAGLQKTSGETPTYYEPTYSYQGWVDAEHPEVTVTAGEITKTVKAASKNTGTYELSIKFAEGKGFSADNYVFEPMPGTLTIDPCQVTFTAADKKVTYGEAEVYALTDGWKAYAVNDDEALLEKTVKITRATTAETEGTNKGKYKLTPSFMTDAEIDAYVEANAADYYTEGMNDEQKTAARTAAKAALKTTRDNYKATVDASGNVTGWVVGYATLSKATLKIALKESAYTLKKVYDGQKVSVTLDKEKGLTFIGLKEGDEANVNKENLKLDVEANSANVGTYSLVLSGATSDVYDISYVPSQYVIDQRPLNMTVGNQTFVVGQVYNLDQTLYTIAEGEGVGLASTDKASEVFKLSADVPTNAKGETTTGGSWTITIVNCGATGSKWANYKLGTSKTGWARVVDPESMDAQVLDTSKKITTKAEKGGWVTISTDRVLNPENWNAMVLPFEISVAELSATFDYAIVNRLNTTATTENHIAFSLEMQTTPANEPFLVKVVGKKTGSEYKPFSLNGLTFIADVVVAEEKAVEAGGNKFTGVYEAKELKGSIYGFLLDDPTGANKNGWYTPSKNAYTIHPLDAYLTYATAKAPKITVEDIDGTVTAIQAVKDGSFREVKAEGWYTIGGVKLQGAPTQKGVYINNGKKVIVK